MGNEPASSLIVVPPSEMIAAGSSRSGRARSSLCLLVASEWCSGARWSTGARSIGGECVVVCVWSLIWGAVAVILHGSRRRRRGASQWCEVDRWWVRLVTDLGRRRRRPPWFTSSPSPISGARPIRWWVRFCGANAKWRVWVEWVTDLGEKKKPYWFGGKEKTLTGQPFITHGLAFHHTGQPFITHGLRASLRPARHAARRIYGPDWPG